MKYLGKFIGWLFMMSLFIPAGVWLANAIIWVYGISFITMLFEILLALAIVGLGTIVSIGYWGLS